MDTHTRRPRPSLLSLLTLIAGLSACAPDEPPDPGVKEPLTGGDGAAGDSAGGGDSTADSPGDSPGDSPEDSPGDSTREDSPADADGDGVFPPEDCDDGAAGVYPGAAEVCDGADQDCDGEVDEGVGLTRYEDGDEDGWGDGGSAAQTCGEVTGYVADASDCDDNNNTIHPEAVELCDGVDQDCDGAADDGVTLTRYGDADGDGWGDPARAAELCAEAAGYVATAGDCDDRSAAAHPGAAEVCGGRDENCDGLVDDDDPLRDPGGAVWYGDADGDGWGDPAAAHAACLPAAGEVADGTDCDDGRADVSPAAQEVCDDLDVDEDCDGASDDADGSTDPAGMAGWYLDGDGDGHGAGVAAAACDLPAGYSAAADDCDDAAGAVYPGALEYCDDMDVDEDCDGLAEDLDADSTGFTDFYLDQDGDGWGKGDTILPYCDAPDASYVLAGGDCADDDAAVSPGAREVCDDTDVDEDCDGAADDADGSADAATMATFWQDQDLDGYGGSVGTDRCDPIGNYLAVGGDCDDADSSVNPAAQEVCDALDVDEDCDGYVDDADPSVLASGFGTWYVDVDGDGWGDPARTGAACDPLVATVPYGWDCDDRDAAIHPGGQEVCDPLDADEDCDGYVDDGDPSTLLSSKTPWYNDADWDGYGGRAFYFCTLTNPRYIATGGDCDDYDYTIHPGGQEVCDDYPYADEDCDGLTEADDPSVDVSTGRQWYVDADDDGQGVASTMFYRCGYAVYVPGYSNASGDCDDTDPTVYRFGPEVCQDGRDTNCTMDCLWQMAHYDPEADLHMSGANGSSDPLDNWDFGAMIAGGGDLDGDGFRDMAVSDPGYDDATTDDLGQVTIYPGGAGGVGAAAATITGATGDALGSDMAVLPDLDGDGTAELLVASHTRSGGYASGGQVWLFTGPAGALTTADAALTLSPSAANQHLGWRVGAAGDQDGDGTEDWAASGYGWSSYRGRVVIMSGAHAGGAVTWGTAGSDLATISGTSNMGRLGSQIDRMDIDGDGLEELIVGASGANKVLIYGHGLSGALTTADADWSLSVTLGEASSGSYAPYGAYGAINAGDTDGDGLDDLAVGCDRCTGRSVESGVAYLFLSPPASSVLTTAGADATFNGNLRYEHAGQILSAGDINGDGIGDLMNSSRDYAYNRNTQGVTVVLYGPFSGTLDIDGGMNFSVRTMQDDLFLGQSAAVIGDVNGDSHDELALSYQTGGVHSVLMFYGDSE